MCGVYPRVCGGTRSVRKGLPCVADGVYPRVCGGTGFATVSLKYATVYPRVCGGTLLPLYYDGKRTGLSPRVRGNRASADISGCAIGSIPACAGEPLVNVIEHALLYSYLEYY